MESFKIQGSMSRKELANKYGVTGKVFANRLKAKGIDFGTVRILLPAQIREIINRIGLWEEVIDDP